MEKSPWHLLSVTMFPVHGLLLRKRRALDSLEVLNRSSGVTYAEGSDRDLCVRFRRLFSKKEIRKVKKVQRVGMKGIELGLICELMKNSKRSDRELAKVLGVSQPTVSRLVKKLEKEGVIREYTMIPDFAKLGFGIASIVFTKLKEPIPEEKLKDIREQVRQTLWKDPLSNIVAMSGMGLNADRVVVAFHEDYSAYTEHLDKIRKHPMAIAEQTDSFLIDLNDKTQYLPLTLSSLADYMIYKNRQKSKGES